MTARTRWGFVLGAILYGFWALMMILLPARGHAMMSGPHPFNPAAIRMFGAALVGNAVLMWAGRGNATLAGLGAIGSGAISLLALYHLATGDFTRGVAMYVSTALSVLVTALLAAGRRYAALLLLGQGDRLPGHTPRVTESLLTNRLPTLA